MPHGYRTLYGWVRETRETLFAYCAAMPPADYTHEAPELAQASIHKTLVHAADCYRFWLARFSEFAPRPGLTPATCPDLTAVRQAFADVDQLVVQFLDTYQDRLDSPISGTVRSQPEPVVVTPRWLLSHTITHEFHHKGQITFLGRLRGHIAPDTDLVPPTVSNQ